MTLAPHDIPSRPADAADAAVGATANSMHTSEVPVVSSPNPPTSAAAGFSRYSIDTARTPDLAGLPTRFLVKVSRFGLAKLLLTEMWRYRGNRAAILNRPCVYGVFSGPVGGFAPRPRLCVGCLRCTIQHPDVVRIERNPQWRGWGDDYFTPQMVETVLGEAATGAVPVKGQGYRGRFGGTGWDGIWTDMSEIVRPTRDGIHGRETISTVIEVGSKPMHLSFDASGAPVGEQPRVVRLDLPVLFDVPPTAGMDARVVRAIAGAATELGTLAVLPLEAIRASGVAGRRLVPLFEVGQVAGLAALDLPPLVIESGDPAALEAAAKVVPESLGCLRLSLSDGWPARLETAIAAGTRVFHLVANYHGQGAGGHIRDLARTAHGRLVDLGVRDRVTLIGSGGIVMAEHVPKALICGFDAVAIDTPVMAALQAQPAGPCIDREHASYSLPEGMTEAWARQRLKNLCGAWRDQLLEVLGAMGMREVRRLRGEHGRAMFQADLEREAFGGIDGFPG